MSAHGTEKLPESDKRVDTLFATLEGQQKTISDNSGLLKDLLIGIENLGENLKNIHKEMDYWHNPEAQAADAELQDLMNKAPEVVVVDPVSTGLTGASVPPKPQHQYPAQRPNIFPIGGLEGMPAASTASEFVTITALRQPYLGAPKSVNQGTQASTRFKLGKLDSLPYHNFSLWDHHNQKFCLQFF